MLARGQPLEGWDELLKAAELVSDRLEQFANLTVRFECLIWLNDWIDRLD